MDRVCGKEGQLHVQGDVRGLLVSDERGIAVRSMIGEPASHYYRNMIGSLRMPVLIGDGI